MLKTNAGDVVGTHLEPLSVDIPEACRLTGLGRSKVYELLQSGEIRSVKCGKRRLVPVAALREWLSALEAAWWAPGGGGVVRFATCNSDTSKQPERQRPTRLEFLAEELLRRATSDDDTPDWQVRLDYALYRYAAAARWHADPTREAERARLEALVAVAEIRAHRRGWELRP